MYSIATHVKIEDGYNNIIIDCVLYVFMKRVSPNVLSKKSTFIIVRKYVEAWCPSMCKEEGEIFLYFIITWKILIFVLIFLGELYKWKVSPLWRHTFLVKYILVFRFSLACSSSSPSLSPSLLLLISPTHGAHESVVSPRDQ